MSPLREFKPFNSRYPDETQIDYLKRIFLIFEGTRTEVQYFEGIDSNRKSLGISTLIELIILEKIGDIESYSHPKKLLELVTSKKEELKANDDYDEEIDSFVIVFDRDRGSFKSDEDFIKFIKEAGNENILALTSPCFEIWLMLHIPNSVSEHILPNKDEILTNAKISNKHTFTSRMFSDLSGMNPKSNLDFEKLIENIQTAIEQEKLIEQRNEEMADKIGSNIGKLIEDIRKDPRDIFLNK